MELYLRAAVKEDMELLYEWANDLEVRRNAFHTEQIAYETHKTWFENVLRDSNILQYILVSENSEGMNKNLCAIEEIGQIRLSLDEEKALISYSIAKNMRGKGYGSQMVSMAEKKIKETNKDIKVFVAQVKYENIASAKVFQKCGYKEYRKPQYLEYRKE